MDDDNVSADKLAVAVEEELLRLHHAAMELAEELNGLVAKLRDFRNL